MPVVSGNIFSDFGNFKKVPKLDVETVVNLDCGSFLLNGCFSNFFAFAEEAFCNLFNKFMIDGAFDVLFGHLGPWIFEVEAGVTHVEPKVTDVVALVNLFSGISRSRTALAKLSW